MRTFDGVNDSIVFSDRSEYDFTGHFTVFSVWKGRSGSSQNYGGILSHANPADATTGFWISAVWLGGTLKVNFSWNDNDNELGTIARGTQYRMVCCYDGSNAIVNLNGTESTRARTDNPAASTGELIIGDENSAYGHQYMDGEIGECAMWNRALTSGERAALAKGFSPLFFRRGLVFYSPVSGNLSPEPNLVLGDTGTVTGAVKADHPSMIYPTNYQSRMVPVAAGGSLIKSINGLAIASVKSWNGLAIASMKSFNGLSNV